MKKLKNLRDILAGFWGISIVARIISKLTNLYVMPKWSGYIIVGIILMVIVLSIYIYFKEKKQKYKTIITWINWKNLFT